MEALALKLNKSLIRYFKEHKIDDESTKKEYGKKLYAQLINIKEETKKIMKENLSDFYYAISLTKSNEVFFKVVLIQNQFEEDSNMYII